MLTTKVPRLAYTWIPRYTYKLVWYGTNWYNIPTNWYGMVQIGIIYLQIGMVPISILISSNSAAEV